jgi:hypothetical protein
MAADDYVVIFRGTLIEGADPAAVRANLAKLFNADVARIEKMFSGQTVIIKKGLDAAGAEKYRAALAKAGALVEIVKAQAEAPAVPAAAVNPVSASPSRPAPSAAGLLPSTVPAAYATRDAPPEALAATMADPGVILVDYTPPRPPTIATEHLSLAEAGVLLVAAESPPEVHYDLSGLTLDPPGVTLVEPRPVPAPDFDLSGLALVEGE